MPGVGFEPTLSARERHLKCRALNHSANRAGWPAALLRAPPDPEPFPLSRSPVFLPRPYGPESPYVCFIVNFSSLRPRVPWKKSMDEKWKNSAVRVELFSLHPARQRGVTGIVEHLCQNVYSLFLFFPWSFPSFHEAYVRLVHGMSMGREMEGLFRVKGSISWYFICLNLIFAIYVFLP